MFQLFSFLKSVKIKGRPLFLNTKKLVLMEDETWIYGRNTPFEGNLTCL